MSWLWLARVDPDKTWAGFKFHHNHHTTTFFNASVSVMVEKGGKALFWSHHWLNGCDSLRDFDDCALCSQEVETIYHLLLDCVRTGETCFRLLRFFNPQALVPQQLEVFATGGFWLGSRCANNKGRGSTLW
jgi:hypothetical protein